jgi:hypothetical protein
MWGKSFPHILPARRESSIGALHDGVPRMCRLALRPTGAQLVTVILTRAAAMPLGLDWRSS